MNNPKISRVKKQQQKYLAALTEMHNTLKSGGSFLAYEWMKKHKLNNNTTKCLVELKAVKRDKLLAAPNWRWTGSEPDLNLVKSILLRCKVIQQEYSIRKLGLKASTERIAKSGFQGIRENKNGLVIDFDWGAITVKS